MTTPRAMLLLLAALGGRVCAAPHGRRKGGDGGTHIGRPERVFARFIPTFGVGHEAGREHAEVRLAVADGEEVTVDVTDSEVTPDGSYMAASGSVVGRGKTDVMVKGGAGGVYGWVALEDEGRAYELTTAADGEVEVAEVPLEKVKPVCEFHELAGGDGGVNSGGDGGGDGDAADAPAGGRDADTLAVHEEAYRGQDLRRLQSQPGARAVLLLDFSAYFINKAASDDVRRYRKSHFYQTWQGVAAGLSMFELNVVTDDRVFWAAPLGSRGRACFYNADGRSQAAVNSFGSDRCGSWNYWEATGYAQARIALHEIGHQFGLLHDGLWSGGRRTEYSGGLAEYRWVPIMGNIYFGDRMGSEALYQWSRGEYSGATNTQDDLALIGRHVPRRGDDITGTVPLRIGGSGEVRAADNRGRIGDRRDSDTFAFRVGGGGGRASLRVVRTEYIGGAMLDVDATLQSAAGRVYARSNPKAVRGASVDVALPAGDYVLVVRGGAEGTPAYGFSNYASLGNYAISGTVTGAASSGVPVPPPPPPPGSDDTSTSGAISLARDNGRTITATSGSVTDGYATYPDNTDVAVTVVGENCRVTWTAFALEASDDCAWDYVELRAGGAATRYCGGALPPPSALDGTDRFTVAFHSDATVVGVGFDLVFSCGDAEAEARALPLAQYNGQTVAATVGTVTDGYTVYPDNTDVAVTVVGRNCRVTWALLDVEASDDCVWDYVEVRAGGTATRYCGQTLPPPLALDGTDRFSIAFHSDATVVGAGFGVSFACE